MPQLVFIILASIEISSVNNMLTIPLLVVLLFRLLHLAKDLRMP